MSKLLEDVPLLARKKNKDGEWNQTEILRLLRNEIENQERCNGFKPYLLKRARTVRRIEGILGQQLRRPQLFSGENMPPITNPGSTNFNPHETCFVCLRKGHLSRECQSKIYCFIERESQKPENQTTELGPSKNTLGNARNAMQLHPQVKNATLSHTTSGRTRLGSTSSHTSYYFNRKLGTGGKG